MSAFMFVEIPWLEGSQAIALTREQVIKYLEDPKGAVAEALGVTHEQYLMWNEANGYVRCEATTIRGDRCWNRVPNVRHMTPTEWVKGQGGYCATHDPRA
jgi:hypothetical protein